METNEMVTNKAERVEGVVQKDSDLEDDKILTEKKMVTTENGVNQSFKVPQIQGISSFGVKKSSNLLKTNFLEEDAEQNKDNTLKETKEIKVLSEKTLKKESPTMQKKSEKILIASTAESLQKTELLINVPYKEPNWGGCDAKSNSYKLEVVKQGIVIEHIPLANKSFFIFGRLPSCDISMDHPSISRHHAVLQYRVTRDLSGAVEVEDKKDSEYDKDNHVDNSNTKDCETSRVESNLKENSEHEDSPGWYIYDLDSTHNTWVNKYKLPSRKYVRVRVGYVLKFGGSTRLYIINGPEDDRECESELSVTELQKLKRETEMARHLEEVAREAEIAEKERLERLREESRGCTWGMDDDYDENDKNENDDPEAVNPFADLTDETLYIDNPKKAIRGFYEREGLEEPKYEFLEENTSFHGPGFKRRCRLELPIDGPNMETLYAEVVVSGKKKDAVVACALEACRILDRHGVLRQSKHESRAKRRRKEWADADFYDSDDDTYLDRTGDVEKKRQNRIQKAEVSISGNKADTHESLTKKLEEVVSEIKELEEKLRLDEEMKLKNSKGNCAEEEEVDELDVFMMSIKSGGLDVKTKINYKRRLLELKHQRTKLQSLVALTKPCDIKLVPNSKNLSNVIFGKKQNFGKLVKTEFKKEIDDDSDENNEEFEEKEKESLNIKSNQQLDIEQTDNILDSICQNIPATNADEKNFPSKSQSNSKTQISDSGSPTLSEIVQTELIINNKEIKCSNEKTPIIVSSQIEKKKTKSSSSTSSSFASKKLKEEIIAKTVSDSLEYATWLPPSDQTGDGKTKLNEKYGY